MDGGSPTSSKKKRGALERKRRQFNQNDQVATTSLTGPPGRAPNFRVLFAQPASGRPRRPPSGATSEDKIKGKPRCSHRDGGEVDPKSTTTAKITSLRLRGGGEEDRGGEAGLPFEP